jgi:integrase/recombinase XerD
MGRRVRGCRVRGRLAPWQAGFEGWLLGRGYLPSAVFHRCCLLAALSLWLERQGLDAWELTEERALLFVAERRAAGLKTWASERWVRLPLEYLREVGAIPPAAEVLDDGPVARVLAGYREYLVLERDLAESTIDRCQRAASLFLTQLPDELEIGGLTAADVSAFLARECPRRTGSSAKSLMSKFRPFVRYLYVKGLVATPLVWVVPAVASQRDRSLPRGVQPAVVAGLLGSCDRRRTVGRRAYAILLLLVRLGLRAGEVAAITLQDVDWRRGEIVIHGEGQPTRSAAVAGRCRRGGRLISASPPGRSVPSGIRDDSGAARAAHPGGGQWRRSPSVRPCRGAGHRGALRYTAATGMLAGGASLEEIAQVLRHRDVKTTAGDDHVDRLGHRSGGRRIEHDLGAGAPVDHERALGGGAVGRALRGDRILAGRPG